MNNTITLSQLITRLAKATGVDNNTARRFLRIFFATVEETLEQGQSISIKGIGTFRRTEADIENGRSIVAFVPDSSFLEELNRPFEMFEAVELADGVDFSEIDEKVPEADETAYDAVAEPLSEPVADSVKEPETEPASVIEEIPVVEEMPEFKTEDVTFFEKATEAEVTMAEPEPQPVDEAPVRSHVDEKPAVTRPDTHTEAPDTSQSSVAPRHNVIVEHDPIVIQPHGTVPTSDGEDEEVPHRDYHNREVRRRPSRLWIWSALFIGVACVLGYFAAVWAVPMPEMYEDEEENIADVAPDTALTAEEVTVEELSAMSHQETPAVMEESKPVVEEPKAEAAPAPAPEPVYDTVSISLIKLAKKHYGVGDYWVFIFDANRDKIKNPNSIRPGTKVRIPDRTELPGKDASETKELARKKSAEYLATY